MPMHKAFSVYGFKIARQIGGGGINVLKTYNNTAL